ncbi:unnamed protein product [Porites lobata]|uniref:AAA+ ATPase domain-containing protein n=1 Tax=Porites lobata TaxID=104759 RepID=A0ABN8SAQ9_9CNID|nr:unnamed protein product [Porites lobata]
MIRQPSSVIIAGPSGSGKTDLVEQWLRYLNVFQVKPRKIVYAYDRWQPRFERMQQKDGIQFYRGLPDPRHLTQWFGRTRGGVLVLDDLMEEGGQDKRVLDLFTKDSHHRNITVLYLTQDLFPPGKFSKTINRNAHYIVAFKNPRDQTGIRTILLQAFPDRWRQVLRLFKRITARPFGYLMLDVHPASDDRYRLWSHLTPREGKAQVHTLRADVPAVRKRTATRTRQGSCTMEPEMVSTTVNNAPAFLQLRDQYKQELVEDTRLTKAADLAAKQHVLLTSDAPDAWKRPQLKAVSRQLRHWTKKVRQPFGAAAGGVTAAGATTPGDDDFEAGPMQAWFTQLVKATQGIKQGTPTGGPRKPPVPPKPRFTPSAKKKLKFTTPLSSEELAEELPFSEAPGTAPWETPKERADTITQSFKRGIRKRAADSAKKKAAGVAKKKAAGWAKKALDWKSWKTP